MSAPFRRAADDHSAIKRCLDEIHRQKLAGLGLSSDERGQPWPKADLVLGKTRNGKLFVLTEKGRRLHLHIPGLSG